MNLTGLTGSFATYFSVFAAAVLEGEVIFVSACVLAALGHLNPMAVVIAGALGGSAGDQFYFYALRGKWREKLLSRFTCGPALTSTVRKAGLHATGFMVACRFLPGLRIAIPTACALAGCSAVKFSMLSVLSGFAWATTLFLLVTLWGPECLSWLGWRTPWAIVSCAMGVVLIAWYVSRNLRSSTCSDPIENESPVTPVSHLS
jgi:membrane protein DedA with SNARE-associated domain